MVRSELSLARRFESVMQPGSERLSGGVGEDSSASYSGVERRKEHSGMNGTSRQSVVWIINEGGHSYDAAVRYGRLMALTSGNVNYYNLSRLMVSIGPKLRAATADDYLLISGSPILVGLCVSMWLARFDRVNLLQWSNIQRDYVHILLERSAVSRMANLDLEQAS